MVGGDAVSDQTRKQCPGCRRWLDLEYWVATLDAGEAAEVGCPMCGSQLTVTKCVSVDYEVCLTEEVEP